MGGTADALRRRVLGPVPGAPPAGPVLDAERSWPQRRHVLRRFRHPPSFLSPTFTPTIYRVQVDTAKGEMRILQRIPLKLRHGFMDPARAAVGGPSSQITGFGNISANAAANVPVSDEVPTTDTDSDGDIDATDATLPFDPYGLDTEGIVFDARTFTFWLVDEYRPSIVQVALDGTILQRITPQGQNVAALGSAWAAVPLRDILPASYSSRRDNRGFEGVALSADGRTLYAVLQSPLATACSGTDPISGEASRATTTGRPPASLPLTSATRSSPS